MNVLIMVFLCFSAISSFLSTNFPPSKIKMGTLYTEKIQLIICFSDTDARGGGETWLVKLSKEIQQFSCIY
jgi:hypothetical protein